MYLLWCAAQLLYSELPLFLSLPLLSCASVPSGSRSVAGNPQPPPVLLLSAAAVPRLLCRSQVCMIQSTLLERPFQKSCGWLLHFVFSALLPVVLSTGVSVYMQVLGIEGSHHPSCEILPGLCGWQVHLVFSPCYLCTCPSVHESWSSIATVQV